MEGDFQNRFKADSASADDDSDAAALIDISITEAISRAASRVPEAIAVICGEHSLTYREMETHSSNLAALLQQKGVRADTPVAVCAGRCIETVIGILAILKAGGAYVPLDPEYPEDLQTFVVEDSGADIVLTTTAAAVTGTDKTTLLCIDEAQASPLPIGELSTPDSGSLAYVLYTSGSTGKPKGVLVTHANLAHSTRARLEFYKNPPERFLLLSSFAFDSSVAGLFWTLCTGGTLVLPNGGEERDPVALAKLIKDREITHTLCLPSLYALILKTGESFSTLKTVIVAGESCPPSLPGEHARQQPGTELYNEYGPTEGTVWSTACRLSPDSPTISIGHPIGQARVYLVDEYGALVPDGEPGEIYIGGPGVARGYLNRSELTASRFLPDRFSKKPEDRIYRTGDLARKLPDGGSEFLGRIDHQVKIRGYRIELEAIEAVLKTHPDVVDAVVTAHDSGEVGKRLVAYFVPADVPAGALRELLSSKLPAYMMPSIFNGLDSLPRMPNGKVNRAALPEPEHSRPELATPFVSPVSAIEQYLTEEWRKILALDRVGIHDAFFDLGGDSLQAAMLMSRVQQRLGNPLFVVALFEAPTVSKLADYLRKNYPAAVAKQFDEPSSAKVDKPKPAITAETIAQVRSTVFTSRPSGSLQRKKNRRAIFILSPPRSGTTLLRAMLARHPGLCTSSELRLLGFETLAERQERYATGGESIWRTSPAELIQESHGCSSAEAIQIIENAAQRGISTADFYADLQQRLAPRELVDKSPSYALNPDALRQAEEIFKDAFYIHLSRHPYEMIRSFEQRRMDQIYLPKVEGITPRQAGELVWLISHENILQFLNSVPEERQHHIRFTDLVTDPRTAVSSLCNALGIRFDSAVLDPYAGASESAVPDLHTSDDPRFREHRTIDSRLAQGWRGVLSDNFLSDLSWELAGKLGYEKPKELRSHYASLPERPEKSASPSVTQADEPIAIIGMAGRFPGASDLETFWANLCAGVESIRPFTPEEFQRSGIDPEILSDPTYVNVGAVPQGADEFAASFFGYTPREAELMDPQQRLFLETAWEAFEHAGYDISRLRAPVGVFAGIALNSYFQNILATRPELAPMLGQYSLTIGNEKDFVASRVAHKLDLRGPAIGIQTACSSSLVALHLACQSLRSGEIGMALVGGGRVRAPLHAGYFYVDGGIPSPDGHCRAFDANARGCVAGSGVAAVVLKRLSDAQRDGDHVYAVIKGTAINNDGADKAGFTAPSVDGQAEVIQRAHTVADVSADSIGYVEAHGTGTSLGDPIEVAALARAFRATSDRIGYCRIGSLKTNIGHLDAGAGVAGLIKTALALDRGVIPPSLHFERPNPQIDFGTSPFVVNAALTKWPRSNEPRRAGVSSFGIGGTNAHAVLEEAPPSQSQAPSREWQLLVLSAKTLTALDRASERLAAWLRRNPDVPIADVAHTLQVGRREFQHRRIIVARSAEDAAEAIENCDSRRVITGTAAERTLQVAFMFPGQGAQHARMAQELFESEPVFRQTLLRCAEALRPELDLIAVLYGDSPDEQSIKATAVAQPAIFAIEYAMASLWASWGIDPEIMLGHSVGEFAAACLAGVLSLEDAIRLVAARARLMQEQPGGSMLAVRLPESEFRAQLPAEIEVAAINSPRLTIVSGPTQAIADFADGLLQQGVACTQLQTSHAFHSRMVEPVMQPFTELARKVPFAPPTIPLISTLTGARDADFVNPEYWALQLRQAVRFQEAVSNVSGEFLLLEVGPGATLAPLARQSRNGAAISSLSAAGVGGDQAAMLEALGRMWLAGVQVDWSLPHGNEQRSRVALPTYPFERERYWLDPVPADCRPAPVIDGAIAPESQPSPVQNVASGDAVPDRLRALLHEMSGVPVERMSASASLLELGFDSLFLTQLTLALRKSFGVTVGFRQLLDEFPTLEALARHIDDAKPAPDETPKLPERALAPQNRSSEAINVGPFRPIQTDTQDQFTARQQAHLDQLIARYSIRTAASKRYAQEHRAHFADPRAISGFRRAWKEIVYPIVAKRSDGARIWDIDGNEYIDFTMGFGTNLLGHSPKFITDAVKTQLDLGIEIGPQSAAAGEAARLLCKLTGMQRATFCNTGSEAVLAAARVARTATGRTRIATFNGYHGITDEFLVRGKWIGDERRSVPIAPGIPEHVAREVIALDYGAPESLELLRAHASELAAVFVEPVQSRHPNLQPREFLHEVRKITREAGALLVFDEMITGFRCHPGGAQSWFDVRADLATYGKILGGGMPVGALCGAGQYMDVLDGGPWNFGDASQPERGVTFFAGTYVRHPLAMAGTLAMLHYLDQSGPALQNRLNERTDQLVVELRRIVEDAGAPFQIESFASMFLVTFAPGYHFGPLLFFHLRENGIHAWDNRLFFLSTAHTEADLALFVETFRQSVDEMRRGGFFEALMVEAAAAGQAGNGREVPFTPAQQEILLAARLDPEASIAFNESSTIDLDGPLDIPRLRHSLDLVISRHDALRTYFCDTAQCVADELTIELPLIDISEINSDAQHTRVAELIAAETAKPFGLESGPLVRGLLIRRSEQAHNFVLTIHHAVCDGWSFNVVLNELAALYRNETLPAAPQFREYAAWLDQQPVYTAETYWLKQFATLPPLLELPTNHPRTSHRSFRSGRCDTSVCGATIDALRQTGAAEKTTLFTVLLGAFCVLLKRLSGQDDIVVGIPAAGQAAMGSAALVGHCINLLPIRAKLENDTAFSTFLQELRGTVLGAFEHQNYTFGRLLQKLVIPREVGRMPLLSVSFNVEQGTSLLDFAGTTGAPIANPKSRHPFELSFNIVEHPDSAEVQCTYNQDLFDETTIRRWLLHYRTLLEGIVVPRTPLSDLPILSEEEKRQLLVEWNKTARDFPFSKTLPELFGEITRLTPAAIAVIDDGEQISYGALAAAAADMADRLRARGVRTGSLVGLPAERSFRFVVWLLSILEAGGAYIPLALNEPADRLAHLRSMCDYVIGTDGEISGNSSRGEQRSATADDPAYVLFTSGSTGEPKGVIVPHRAITRLVCNSDYVSFQADDVVAFASNPCFDAATFELWGALLNGARLVITPAHVLLSPAALEEHFTRHGVTTAFLTTSLFNQLAQQAPAMFRNLRSLVFGGEAADTASVRLVLEHGKPANLVNGYGPTEATTFAVCHRTHEVHGPRVPIGRPIANTQAFILDHRLEPVPIGVAGELYIGGPGVALGYLNSPDLTSQRFLDTPYGRLYKTGDLARWLPDGTIDYLGRRDQQIKLRGFRIEPGEVQAAVRQIPGVAECAVLVREITNGDRRLVAYFTMSGIPAPSAEVFRETLRRILPEYMVPSAFIELPQLPLTANGKLAVEKLPLHIGSDGPQSAFVEPRNALDSQMIEIWEDLLNHRPIGIRDNFFALGGHSLLAARMLAQAEARLGRRPAFSTLFENPTIEHLSNSLLTQQQADATEQPFVAIHPTGTRSPFFFLHGDYVGGGFFCQTLARHLGPDRPFYAVHPHGLIGDRPSSISAMAAERLALIRRLQPHGPYFIGGYCNGALTAFEIARLLRSEGEEVAALIMLTADGSSYRVRHWEIFANVVGQMNGEDTEGCRHRFLRWRHTARLAKALVAHYASAGRDLLRRPWSEQKEQIRNLTRRIYMRLTEQREVSSMSNRESHAGTSLSNAFQDAVLSFIPYPFAGNATLLWPKDEPALANNDPRYGWEQVCDSVELVLVPGNHHSCISQSRNLGPIGDEIRRALEKAESKRLS